MNDRRPPLALPGPTAIRGWGGMSASGIEVKGEDLQRLTEGAVLSRGHGRSYGDASLPPRDGSHVVNTTAADRLLSFDPDTGVLHAQAGVSLSTLKRVFLNRGFYTPVSPGTQYVTLGGMVASDVHGKGHHVAGTFGDHVRQLKMRVASGDIVTCSRDEHPDLFLATLGGMGLTGHVLEVTFQMRKIASPWVWRECIQMPELDALIDGLEASARDWPMTVAWIDTLATGRNFGRGLLMRGRWASPDEAPPHPPGKPFSPMVPYHFPNWALNDLSIKAFNFAYYWKQLRREVVGPVTPQSWWYPLDGIQHWHRIYGHRGFTQHQCVIPRAAGRDKVRDYCRILARRGGTSFLCVIKDCGPQSEGLLSFPMEGTSVALDLPIRHDTQDLIDELNEFVIDVGGRIYLTKDGFTRREHFQTMEAERLPRFEEVRRRWDPDLALRSALSVRLLGDPEAR
jgi:FAD/FMN-containing dehydrogenase